jgi:hypothetical protein
MVSGVSMRCYACYRTLDPKFLARSSLRDPLISPHALMRRVAGHAVINCHASTFLDGLELPFGPLLVAAIDVELETGSDGIGIVAQPVTELCGVDARGAG